MSHGLSPATSVLARLVSGVRPDHLDAPTPCPDFTVADLLDHIGGLSVAFTHAGTRTPLPERAGAPSADGSRLPEDFREVFTERLDALARAWAHPSAVEGLTQAGPIEMPADIALLVALDEVVVHAWDLAAATGQPYDPRDADVEACLGFATSFRPPEDAGDGIDDGAPGLFGPPLTPAPDAGPLDRLLAATGRDPHWRP